MFRVAPRPERHVAEYPDRIDFETQLNDPFQPCIGNNVVTWEGNREIGHKNGTPGCSEDCQDLELEGRGRALSTAAVKKYKKKPQDRSQGVGGKHSTTHDGMRFGAAAKSTHYPAKGAQPGARSRNYPWVWAAPKQKPADSKNARYRDTYHLMCEFLSFAFPSLTTTAYMFTGSWMTC